MRVGDDIRMLWSWLQVVDWSMNTEVFMTPSNVVARNPFYIVSFLADGGPATACPDICGFGGRSQTHGVANYLSSEGWLLILMPSLPSLTNNLEGQEAGLGVSHSGTSSATDWLRVIFCPT